ncbi:MAG: hypothetical protein ACLU9S_11030 [Oscillospiraceae bacterium]
MKRWGICLVLCGLLCCFTGCSAGETAVWETVGDQVELLGQCAGPWIYHAGCGAYGSAHGGGTVRGTTKVYVQRDGAYELTSQTLTAESLDSLLQTLTGFPQSSLQVLQTEEFGMPRYDVAWTASGDQGMESCRAAILDDGIYYYVLTASVEQEAAAQNRETLDQVFATLGLYADEGF